MVLLDCKPLRFQVAQTESPFSNKRIARPTVWTLGMSIAMMFSKDDHTALPFGLAAVISAVFVAGMGAAKASHDNTRTILRALKRSHRRNSRVTDAGSCQAAA
jgi:hypothetical protein